jgi:hypothetical protein
MKTKPLTGSEIPETFNLSTYAACATWGLEQWCSAVSERRLLRMTFEMALREPDDSGSSLDELVKERSAIYFRDPLPRVSAKMTPFEGHESPVRDASALDFFDGYFAATDSRYDRFSTLAKAHVGDEWLSDAARDAEILLKSTAAWEMHREAGVHSEEFMVAVDLGASDEMIIREFKTWLRATRKAVGSARIKPAFVRQDFEDWHEKRLLPFLDLTFWALVRGGHFTLPVLADAIFPNVIHVGVEDRIRKVIAPDAAFIVSPHMVSAMNVQLNAERK